MAKDQTMKQFDLKNIQDLIRGETPADIQRQAASMCSTFLSGVWSKIEPNQLNVRRVHGGMTSQAYHCSLPDGIEPINKEPKEVFVKFYRPKWLNYFDVPREEERATDAVISTVVSERGLGPKCYGVCPVGEVLEYIESRQFFQAEESNPNLVKKVAQKLAHVHHLEVPIDKTNYYFRFLKKCLTKAEINGYKNQFDLDKLANEVEFIKRQIAKLDPQVVFNHNDFRNSNIMVKPDDELVICDFEYGAYSYRAIDFAWVFLFWGGTTIEFDFKADDSVLYQFFATYAEECEKINEGFKKNSKNLPENLVKEAKVFFLACLLWSNILYLSIDKQMVEGVEHVLPLDMFKKLAVEANEKYFEYKQKLIKEKIITED